MNNATETDGYLDANRNGATFKNYTGACGI